MSNQHMKKLVFIAIFSLSILCGFLINANIQLKKSFDGLNQRKEEELASRLAREKQFIRKDLEEKYAADIVSCNAMAKQLELEKQKSRSATQDKVKGER